MSRRKRELLPSNTCPHLTLDGRDRDRPICRQCGTPWALVQASDRDGDPDLFGGAA